MLSSIGLVSLILIFVNLVFTYKGLKHAEVFEQYSFHVDNILIYKDYKRLVTSGFLHVNWIHFLFNMMSLFVFSQRMEFLVDTSGYLSIYFISLIGGNLLALYIHRNHGDYNAAGASGAVFGIIFACIGLNPAISVGLFFIPVYIPGWVFGILFVLYSVYGIYSKKDNIGHEAHLGGALLGLITAVITHPTSLFDNYQVILAILVPGVFFIGMMVTRPHLLLIDKPFSRKHKTRVIDIDDRYNINRTARRESVDTILEKVHRKGIHSLSRKEKELLEQHGGSE
ncbi:rhomboid family intramembrane serine protease [Chitinophaga rhizophila]|uniref:Rhomboid family intramembrane serine protease n=1 Tax=Chitinophaga rhizophila TaxID=2866212 RepID=A0ABS7G654_9BACT|nr:rhomboid family intramembrane serine protease [Chitinophaga rhizophila]MBW8683138.1 rhomboid family intramembrane serine protease [Chitinophaga rhizophila]